jgi:transcriptional regulator with XRE-family HTH domain
MPNIDPAAKTWELDLARRIGEAVKARRKALKLTAVELAERTKELGYPITRVAITKIEGNNRAGKFDVAELLVIAAALNTSPALLLYPGPYNEDVELLPGEVCAEFDAVQWFSGSGYWKTIQGDDTDARAAGRSWAASARTLRTWRALAAAEEQRMWLVSRADDRDRQQIAFLDDQIRRLREELGLADNA